MVSRYADGDSTFHQYDALGSTTGLTDESGFITVTSHYMSQGLIAFIAVSWGNSAPILGR